MTGFISFSRTERSGRCRGPGLELRYDHPNIASSVQYDIEEKRCFKMYETFRDSSAQEKWLEETFKVVREGVSGTQWCNNDPPVPDLPTLFLIKAPLSTTGFDDGKFHADLVVRAPHDIIDGTGTLILVNSLFAHAARAYDEHDPYEPLEISASSFNAAPRADVEIATFPFKEGREGPGQHQRAAITVSITHASHTAIALVVRDHQEGREEERVVRYINYSLINERGHCVEPYSTSVHPASVYHSVSGKGIVVGLAVPAACAESEQDTEFQREEYISTATHVRFFYHDIRTDKDHIFLTPPVPRRNESPSVLISSMGVLDNVIAHRHGLFSVEDPWVTGEELGTGPGTAYNAAWHDEEGAKGFLKACQGLVGRGLG
ncbi:hypothetical protein BJX63DRAFT_418223 [Aspergillus granulosus]|uniref:Uncharacterized protein n=1 Tax=Aspergillus granulosus TaxID=176169 RepID=A0ABR4I0S2_9EURO